MDELDYQNLIRMFYVYYSIYGADDTLKDNEGKTIYDRKIDDPEKMNYISGFIKYRNNLFKAVKEGSLVNVKSALKFITVNARDPNGDTPLHIAAADGNEEIAGYLLSLPNIDVNVRIMMEILQFI